MFKTHMSLYQDITAHITEHPWTELQLREVCQGTLGIKPTIRPDTERQVIRHCEKLLLKSFSAGTDISNFYTKKMKSCFISKILSVAVLCYIKSYGQSVHTRNTNHGIYAAKTMICSHARYNGICGSEGTTPNILNLSTQWRWVVQFHAQAALTTGKDFPVLTNNPVGPRVWSGRFITVSYFKMRQYFQNKLSDTYWYWYIY
jgi:hypothetical protein